MTTLLLCIYVHVHVFELNHDTWFLKIKQIMCGNLTLTHPAVILLLPPLLAFSILTVS